MRLKIKNKKNFKYFIDKVVWGLLLLLFFGLFFFLSFFWGGVISLSILLIKQSGDVFCSLLLL